MHDTSPQHPPGREPIPLRPLVERGNTLTLPRPLTSFVGREAELPTVRAMLARDGVRLLSLTGPGGVGKTRLAIRVAEDVSEGFPDGAIWVPLVNTRDPALVGPAIARAAQVSHPTRPDAAPTELLRSRRALLVLDNFEHVINAAPLIATLLAECPDLTILVTSRQALELAGEHIYAVPPFSVADLAEPDLQEPAHATEAIRLFIERAQARDATFALDPDNAGDIAAICTALDGLPLAIELAAAQIPTLTPATLLPRLKDRLSILTRGPIDAHDRHRTMHAAIEWSHDLLDTPLQAAFRRLAVFEGGFSLDAAVAMLGDADDVLNTLSALVARSLIVARPTDDGDTRYWMLETLREFGLARLGDSGDELATRDRHAAWMQTVADRCETSWFKPMAEGESQLAELERELPNARAALQWLESRGDTEAALRLAGNLGGLWFVRGYLREGSRWLDAAREPKAPLTTGTHAKALLTRSWIAEGQGHLELAIHLAEAGMRLAAAQDRPDLTVSGLVFASLAASAIGDHARAQRGLQESLRLLDAHGSSPVIYNQRTTHAILLGIVAMRRGDLDRAEAMFGEAVERQLAAGQKVGHGYIYGGHILRYLGDMARIRGDDRAAIEMYREHLPLAWRYQYARMVCYDLGGIGAAVAGLGDTATAARLLGASERAHESYGIPFDNETLSYHRAFGLPEPWAREDQPCPPVDELRAALRARRPLDVPPIDDLDEAGAAWEAGRNLALADAVDEALAVEFEAPPAVPNHGLTAREVEVLRLVVEGRSDVEIASELYISNRTVATHIRHIYDKLDISSRAEAAAWAVRNGIA